MRPHPSLSFPTAREMVSTLYFWWLAYLRSSLDFWWICQQKGKCEDPRLVKVWTDFGDIYQYKSIIHWWNEHGERLFNNPQTEMSMLAPRGSGIKVLTDKDLVNPFPEMLCLAVPFSMDPLQASTFMFDTWKKALMFGAHIPSCAKYQIRNFDGKSKKTIVSAYQSIALEKCVKQTQTGERINNWGCYEMGIYLKLGRQEISQQIEKKIKSAAVKKQRSIRSLFCQNKLSAAKYISNVEVGIFPSIKDVEKIPRWTKDQEISLVQAVAAGEWRGLGWFYKEHEFMFPSKAPSFTEDITQSQKVLSKLDSFSSVETRF